MKKLICVLLLVFSNVLSSQIRDLASLSTGSYVSFSPLFNKQEQLFGYLALFNKGKETETTNKFEYVYLDKNLNEVANNEFSAESSVVSYSSYINTKGEIELSPRINQYFTSMKKMNNTIIPKDKVIDIKANKISQKEEICYENKQFIDCGGSKTIGEYGKEAKKERKENGFNYESDVTILNDGTYLVYEYKYEKGNDFDNAFIKFDENKKEVWRYEFNKDMKKREKQFINVLYFDNTFLYLIEYTDLKKENSYKLLKIDLKTGNRVIDEEIKNYSKSSVQSLRRMVESGYYITNKKEFEDKLILIGKINNDKDDVCTGYFRMIIEKATNKITYTDMPFLSAKPFLENIKANGSVENGYGLNIRDLYILKDGSVGFLFEKYKIGYNLMLGNVAKATDLVYFSTDKDLKIKEVKVFSKDKSLGYNSDYLFSQYINNDQDVAFFYRDYQKDEDGEKNWNLYINTIKTGVYSQEKIPISSKENSIVPYVAKEGYILLREYNKKSKYNGIRLERLNY
ncbi:MAG TPA: hypothetical protein PLP39_02835 [Flavobacterium lutivivi]|nr:hypothetical protein [Flavobacterium lutivivi]